MTYYSLSKEVQSDGAHQVHKFRCEYYPKAKQRIGLGEYAHFSLAVAKARGYYDHVNGCAHCCKDCHFWV